DGAAGRRNHLVRLVVQRRRMNVDVAGLHGLVLVHEADAVVVGRAPDTRVGGDVHTELAGELEGGCFGEARVAGNVEGDLRAEQGRVVACALDDLAHRRVLGPLPGSPGQVAVRQDEA